MAKQQSFEIEITYPAEKRYQEEILAYLVDNFSIKRALEIDANIIELISTLSLMPEKGTLEPNLKVYPQQFRFILYKETRNFEIKIIYFVNKSIGKIYITDFFPVLMQPNKLKIRS
ncbi:MAG: hypothetical protein KF732_01005 [Flavobacteriales bacterium]|nr:hypothetical protein [Flavobacteriales bacterium]MBX2958508.1 hypothetical protein [Flavobacteriales bacterium]